MDCGTVSNLFVRVGCYLNNIHGGRESRMAVSGGFCSAGSDIGSQDLYQRSDH